MRGGLLFALLLSTLPLAQRAMAADAIGDLIAASNAAPSASSAKHPQRQIPNTTLRSTERAYSRSSRPSRT